MKFLPKCWLIASLSAMSQLTHANLGADCRELLPSIAIADGYIEGVLDSSSVRAIGGGSAHEFSVVVGTTRVQRLVLQGPEGPDVLWSMEPHVYFFHEVGTGSREKYLIRGPMKAVLSARDFHLLGGCPSRSAAISLLAERFPRGACQVIADLRTELSAPGFERAISGAYNQIVSGTNLSCWADTITDDAELYSTEFTNPHNGRVYHAPFDTRGDLIEMLLPAAISAQQIFPKPKTKEQREIIRLVWRSIFDLSERSPGSGLAK